MSCSLTPVAFARSRCTGEQSAAEIVFNGAHSRNLFRLLSILLPFVHFSVPDDLLPPLLTRSRWIPDHNLTERTDLRMDMIETVVLLDPEARVDSCGVEGMKEGWDVTVKGGCVEGNKRWWWGIIKLYFFRSIDSSAAATIPPGD